MDNESPPAQATQEERSQEDITTVTVNGVNFDNAVIDPGNDRTMMSLHVAEKLGLELGSWTRGVIMAKWEI